MTVKGKILNFPTTVLCLVNGMIGGSILVIPIIALQGGWLYTIIVIAITAFFSYYTCYITIIHIGDQRDLDNTLQRHFHGNKGIKIFYDICVCLGIILLMTLYFNLIVIQWEGLVPPYQFTLLNCILNGVLILAWCILLKFFQFGAKIMAYGVVSILLYLIFLIWVIADAPQGNNSFPALGTGIGGFAATMSNAFSIQGIFIPIIKYNLVLIVTFLVGSAAYIYIAYVGGFGILNRTICSTGQTIEGCFSTSDWEVKLLQAVYLIHLYSVVPQYILVAKKRLFSMVGLKQSSAKSINIPQLIFIFLMVVLMVVLGTLQINIDIIININGAVLGFCFVYLIPMLLHIKCVYFPRNKRPMSQLCLHSQTSITPRNTTPVIELTNRDQKSIRQYQLSNSLSVKSMEKDSPKKSMGIQGDMPTPKNSFRVQGEDSSPTQGLVEKEQTDFSYYYCGVTKPSVPRQVLDWVLLIIMMAIGVFVMVSGMYQVVQEIQS